MASLTLRTARQAFIRDQSLTEATYRRERFAVYQKALWAFAARVKVIRDLEDAARLRLASQPGRVSAAPYDMALTKKRQDECRDAIADLRMFASSETQDGAWAGYEALSQSFNLLVSGDRPASDQAFQAYEEAFARFAGSLNKELAQINYMLYAYDTPLWRAVLGKVRGKPLPFEVNPSADPGTALIGAEDRTAIQ